MLQALFHAWERRLASVTTDRVVRLFDGRVASVERNTRKVGVREVQW